MTATDQFKQIEHTDIAGVDAAFSGLKKETNEEVAENVRKKLHELGEKVSAVNTANTESTNNGRKPAQPTKVVKMNHYETRNYGRKKTTTIVVKRIAGKKRYDSTRTGRKSVKKGIERNKKSIQLEQEIKTNYWIMMDAIKNPDTNNVVRQDFKTVCSVKIGHEATQEEMEEFALHSGYLEELALEKTVITLAENGRTEEEITASFEAEATEYLEDDELREFKEYIHDFIHDIIVHHTYEKNLEDNLKVTTPGAATAYSDMVKYGQLKKLEIRVSNLKEKDIKELLKPKNKNNTFVIHIQQTNPDLWEELLVPREKRNEEDYNNAVFEAQNLWNTYMPTKLTEQARITAFNTIYTNTKGMAEETSDGHTSKVAYIQHTTKGLKSSIHISGAGNDSIYTQQMLKNPDGKTEISSLTGEPKTVDTPTTDRGDKKISTAQALRGNAPITLHETNNSHKEETQKYLYQECILTEVCNAIRLQDNTKSIDSIATIHRSILKLIDSITGSMSPAELQQVLQLVSSDAWQYSMSESTLPLTLTPHQAKISPVANNMAWFWGKYIGGYASIYTTDSSENKPVGDLPSPEDIISKIEEWNELVSSPNMLEGDEKKLKGLVGGDASIEKIGGDIYSVRVR